MEYNYDVQDKRAIKRLKNSQRFQKYPSAFLSDTCQIKINGDDYLLEDEFTIKSKNCILPKQIYIFGKKNRRGLPEDNLYLNYWLEVFLKTVEQGILCKYDFEKSNSKAELTIGLTFEYREKAFNYRDWSRQNIIAFLECLFDCKLEETNFEQQDFLELAA